MTITAGLRVLRQTSDLVFEDKTDDSSTNPFSDMDSRVGADLLCSDSNKFVPRTTLDNPIDYKSVRGLAATAT